MKALILENIYSSTRKGLQYAKKGEAVNIVSDFDTVVIVENTEGNKFPVKKTEISYEKKSSLFD